ncbi:hypothetical protein PV08_08212 [Exophiala spinifera]|uniref:AB hydrolase-1 domain-containing protein n=1 Tax=Exophiala spinifera TaxID=91928 RepID=A0A0D2B364_9EURO|nr:uncharacterized protein PV08_08212 [Exophiala spinifera]KIW13025.1 hypothetical protein PV08_08212 [Exophiala spinifera]
MASTSSQGTSAAVITQRGFVTLPDVKNVNIYYELHNPVHARTTNQMPVVLLSNSLAANTALWKHVVDSFSAEYTILTYDHRFHGKSPLPDTGVGSYDFEQGHDIADLAADVIALLDALKVQKVHAAVGLSIGAAVVLVAGASNPGRFDQILVVGTKAEASPGDDASHDARIDLAKAQGMSAMNEQSLKRWFGEGWIAKNPDTAAFVKDEVLAGTPVEGFIASVQALKRLNLWASVDKISQEGHGDKFLFVVGEDDAPVVVRDTKALAERAGSAFVEVGNSGHIVSVQNPEALERLIRERLGRHLS